ncbi:vegetative cell wall protein gp1 isoform X1 [Oreochromis niloticus]|uniref:Coiled-coil-helix-coiled-coil-helix domain containing 3b n=1 Tax=Oreochromis niloticus TaxID=8128 RepID=A0A669B5G3_ORENI|nr:vegetative cell wall protein gp1 isoform X1 [Oreochromis niloticus]
MGGNSPSQFSGEDEGGGITFLKGIRLSDRVIKRMKLSPEVVSPHLAPASKTVASPDPTSSVEHLSPPPPTVIAAPPPSLSPPSQGATVPTVEPAPSVKLIPPPPVKFHSFPPASPEPAAQTPSTPSPGVEAPVEPLPPPPAEVPPSAETLILPTSVESSQASLAPPEPSSQTPPTIIEPATVTQSVEPLESVTPSPPPVETVQLPPTIESTPCGPVEEVDQWCQVEAPVVAPAVDPEPPCDQSPPPPEDALAPPPPTSPVLSFEETSPSCHCVEQAVVPTHPPLAPPPPTEEPPKNPSVPPFDEKEVRVVTTPPPPATMSEDELRQKLKEEMQRSLKEEIDQKRQALQRQLEEMRAQVRAEARAAARARVEEQVKKILEAERAASTEKLTDTIMKERMKTEDEKLMVQLYWMELKAHQLEEKEKELKKRDALYKEHLAKLDAKCAEFYKVSVESFRKGKEETLSRFTRFNTQPVCGDLQSQILKCYKENTGKTLCCSRIASAYMQCVDEAKKNKMSTGG